VLTYKGGDVLQPQKKYWRGLYAYGKRITHGLYLSPLSPDEYLACYSGRKKKIYSDAFKSLAERPIELKDFMVKAFIKKEKDKLLSSSSDPRIIQPRHPRYLVSLGRYIRPLERILYARLTGSFRPYTRTDTPVCLKGLNYLQRGNCLKAKWDSFARPVAISLDASRFDLHVSTDALKYTHFVYQSVFGNDPTLKFLLRERLTTKGIAWSGDGAFRYKKKGGRCSGDNDTSLGNVLIMLTITHAFLRGAGIPHVEIANDGDDQVMIVEEEDEGKVRSIEMEFIKAGFRLTLEPTVSIFERIDFCQTRPVCVAPGCTTMVRYPRLAMTKDLTTFLPIERGRLKLQMLAAIGKCGLACYNDVPVLGNMYRRMVEVSKGENAEKWWRNTGTDPAFTMLSAKAATNVGLSDYTRVSFYKAFGLTPDFQVALEREWDKWTPTFDIIPVEGFHGGFPIADGDV